MIKRSYTKDNRDKLNVIINSKGKELDFTRIKPQRGGVVVYCKDKDLLLAFGIDTKTQEITDFAGGIKYSIGENALEGAMREFSEETLGVFGSFKKEDFDESIVICDEDDLIIFLKLSVDKEAILESFREKLSLNKQAEVSNIIWMSEKEVMESIQGKGERKMFFRLRNFLSRAENFLRLLTS